MARLLLDAICNGDEVLAHELILSGTYGCVDSQTSRRDGTALFFCCSSGYLGLAQMLLARGASVHAQNKNLATPLHAASDRGYLSIVKLLICYNANVNAQTHRGDTPLHLAAYRGHTEVSRCLVEAGADARLLNSCLVTAEHEARCGQHEQVSSYLRAVDQQRYPDDPRGPDLDMLVLDPPSDLSRVSSSHLQVQPPPQNLPCRRHSDTQIKSLNKPQSPPLSGDDVSLSRLAPPLSGDDVSLFRLAPPTCTVSRPQRLNLPHNCDSSASSKRVLPSGLMPPASLPHCPKNNGNRRPSTCSNCSCFSEASGGSDAVSLASDVSSGYGEGRRDDSADFQDAHYSSHNMNNLNANNSNNNGPFHSSHNGSSPTFPPSQLPQRISDVVVSAGAVSQSPTLKSFNSDPRAQANPSCLPKQLNSLQHTHPQDEFASIYDSSLFGCSSSLGSVSSCEHGPGRASQNSRESSMCSGSSFLSMDVSSINSLSSSNSEAARFDDFCIGKPSNDRWNLTGNSTSPQYLAPPSHSRRHGLSRAMSVQGPPTIADPAPNVRPDYNKSLSTEPKPRFTAYNFPISEMESVQSNDLSSTAPPNSSSASSSDYAGAGRPSVPMTCVNIPLN